MLTDQQDVYYYITLMNENYAHPGLDQIEKFNPNVREGILKGMYLWRPAKKSARAQLLGSGAILREVIAAADLLEKDWKIDSNVWSCPSFTELRREGLAAERWNLLHPGDTRRVSHVEALLQPHQGPVVAATDYLKSFPDQIRFLMPAGRTFRVLGTDGFGRSDTRQKLRHFFEVDRFWITVATLRSLADDGVVKVALVSDALRQYGLDPSKPDPVTV